MTIVVTFGFATNGWNMAYGDLKRLRIEAEALGFDSLTVHDNVVGEMPKYKEMDIFEGWTIMSALAETTTKTRLMLLCNIAGRRHPALVAKIGSTVDVISKGRLVLGMAPGNPPDPMDPIMTGTGYQFEDWGMHFDPKASTRIEMMCEEIEIIKRMWTQENASFKGKYYTIPNAVMNPKPVQKPHPPIWLGIQKRKVMPRVAAEIADGFNVTRNNDDGCKEVLQNVEHRCRELGRDFDRIEKSRTFLVAVAEDKAGTTALLQEEATRRQVSVDEYIRNRNYVFGGLVIGTPEECAEKLKKSIDMGFDHLNMWFVNMNIGKPSVDPSPLRLFAREVIPALRDTCSR